VILSEPPLPVVFPVDRMTVSLCFVPRLYTTFRRSHCCFRTVMGRSRIVCSGVAGWAVECEDGRLLGGGVEIVLRELQGHSRGRSWILESDGVRSGRVCVAGLVARHFGKCNFVIVRSVRFALSGYL
jgi:hypothetical protein